MSSSLIPERAAGLRRLGSTGARGLVVGHSLPAALSDLQLAPFEVPTPFGHVELHRGTVGGTALYVLYRHGVETSSLAHELNYRANIWALRTAGCSALLLLSSVGIVDEELPLNEPLVIDDLLMFESKLPDGTPCTYGEGYLIAQGTLFSPALREQFRRQWALDHGGRSLREVSYAFLPGPRTKSPLENRALRALGVQTNSMTLGPEAVLANELGIATFAVGIGHVGPRQDQGFGRATPDGDNGLVDRSLKAVDFSEVVRCFLTGCDQRTPVETFIHTRKAAPSRTEARPGDTYAPGRAWAVRACVTAGVATAAVVARALWRGKV